MGKPLPLLLTGWGQGIGGNGGREASASSFPDRKTSLVQVLAWLVLGLDHMVDPTSRPFPLYYSFYKILRD